MTRPPLRIATADGPSSQDMAEAIEAMMRECIAAQPVAVMVIWEISTATSADVHCRSVPDSQMLRRGMVDAVFDHLHPEIPLE